MPFYTPLRYPGGKRRLARFVSQLLRENELHDVEYVEPYAGGASLALALLLEEHAANIHINDLSRPIYAFWYSVLNDTDSLCSRIEETDVTMDEWHRQHQVYEQRDSAPLLDLGFATFFLNRTNRSGIIAGGVIGGKEQLGEWALDARFTKPTLVQRIRRIGRYKGRIHLYQMDALDFTNSVIPRLGMNTFSFYDPPYIDKGDGLYLNEYTIEGHSLLADRVAGLEQPWVVTYDYDAAVRHGLYPNHRRLSFHLSYSAQDRRKGREVMFLSDRLALPVDWGTHQTFSLSGPKRRHSVFGRMERMPDPTDMEGLGAAERFVESIRAVIKVPKEAVPNPFKKPNVAGKKKPANLED